MYDALVTHRLYLAAAGISFLGGLLLTPLVRRLADRLDIVDHPDTHRKLHAKSTPLGGGVAVLLAFGIAVVIVALWSDSQREVLARDAKFLLGFAAASVAICALGLIDDAFGLRGRQKMVGQVAVAAIILVSGLRIERVELFGWSVELGLLALPFTLFWLLGAINALNLIDGVDGLATGVGVVLSVSIAAIAGLTGHRTEAFLALAMAGALLGFLRYNGAPATIFLGDAGSMLIGLVLGTLAIRGSFKGPATAALAAPAAIWAIPIFDVVTAIIRRRLTGRSIYATDRCHFHHTLLKRGFSSTKTATTIGLLCAVTSASAVFSVAMNNEYLAVVVVASVFAVLVMTRFHGHLESRLLGQRFRHFLATLVPSLHKPHFRRREIQARLEGDHQWEDLWEMLATYAERFDLSSVQLNITLPAHGEEFHASWQRKEGPDYHEVWHTDIPLVAHGVRIGRLKITGACNNDSVFTWMGDLIAGLQPFESQLIEIVEDCIQQRRRADPCSVEFVPLVGAGGVVAASAGVVAASAGGVPAGVGAPRVTIER